MYLAMFFIDIRPKRSTANIGTWRMFTSSIFFSLDYVKVWIKPKAYGLPTNDKGFLLKNFLSSEIPITICEDMLSHNVLRCKWSTAINFDCSRPVQLEVFMVRLNFSLK